MAILPKIEPDELITKYQLHPDLMDVFVEGEFDKDFLLNYFSSIEHESDITILPIDRVNIKADIGIFGNQASNSNKDCVITLSKMVENELAGGSTRSIFIIDADCDRFRNRLRDGKYLFYTDFTCMEMYFYNTSTLKKFLTFTCNLDDHDRDDFITAAENILPVLFSIRTVNEALSLNLATPSFTIGLTSKGNLSSFSQEKYLHSYLPLIAKINDREAAKTEFTSIIENLPTDLRHKAHGHDFITLLFDFLWRRSSVKLHNKTDDVLKFGGRILGTALNISELSSSTLFQRLSKHI